MVLIFFITFISCVYGVLSITPFINKGQRAEFFELTDNEVGVIRVTLPDKEFITLKRSSNYRGLGTGEMKIQYFGDSAQEYFGQIERIVENLKEINFNKIYPGYNFTEELKELKINVKGYPTINVDKILNGIDTNLYNYYDYDIFYNNSELFPIFLIQSNKNFNLIEIYSVMASLKMTDLSKISRSLRENFISQFQSLYYLIIAPTKYMLEYAELNSDDESCLNYISSTMSKVVKSNEIDGEFYNKIKKILDKFNYFEENFSNNYIDSYEEYNNYEEYNYEENNYGDNINFNEYNNYENNNNYEYYNNNNNDDDNNNNVEDNYSFENDFNYENNNIEGSTGDNEEEFEDYYVDFEFKTKNATMIVELNGEQKNFDKVTFSLGGEYSRTFSKPGFNLKIRGDKELYGRKQFKLRSDCNEATYMRTKIASDIHNRLGIPSVSANYVTLYINGEYMGLYIIMDVYKLSWVEYVYGEKNSTSLYQCNGPSDLTLNSAYSCSNENDDVEIENQEWIDLLTTLDNAQSASDIEKIFDVDHFLKEMALEYLFGSWDHILRHAHNFYMYKQKNGKWIYLSHDFDHDLGQDIDIDFRNHIYVDVPDILYNSKDYFYPDYSFAKWVNDVHIVDILILKDSRRFDKILKDIVRKVFNPATLYPHIDEIKEFIRPYVVLDKTSDAKGKYPGRINKKASDFISLAQWDANVEFTSVKTPDFFGYGLKYWILSKYRYVCKTYGIKCDSTYMNENYKYSINKEVEFHGYYKNISDSSSSITLIETTSSIH